MSAYETEIKLTEKGTLTLRDLPFEAGESVRVVVSGTNGATQSNGASTQLQESKENWATALARECDELCRKYGYGDAPEDFAATWKQEKARRIMEQSSQP